MSDDSARPVLDWEDFLGHFGGVRKSGPDKAMAKCPLHDDGKASLSLTNDRKNGRYLLHCFVCGKSATGSILSAAGLKWQDVNPDRPKTGRIPPDKVYRYEDEEGALLFEVERRAGKVFPQRRPPRPSDSESDIGPDEQGNLRVWNMSGVRLVLYRLPQVLEAVKAGKLVVIVEGEKDADNAAAMGLNSTTSPQGAGKWRPYYSDFLAGADVLVIPDNDSAEKGYPGQKHVASIVRSLKGKAKRVRVLELPGDGVKDFTDWRDKGGTIAEFNDLAEKAIDGDEWVRQWKDRLTEAADSKKDKAGKGKAGRQRQAKEQPKPEPAPDPEKVRQAAEEARVAAGDLFTDPNPLDRYYQAAQDLGLVGEEQNFKVLVLVLTSRVLSRPVNVYVTGESSSGKTFMVSCARRLFPESASIRLDGASPRTFVYDSKDYRHRVLFLNEVDGFATSKKKDGDNTGVALLRSLIDSNRINYQATVKNEDGTGFTVQEVTKEGPTGVIFTGCHEIDDELTNRCLVLSPDESKEQTRRVKAAICHGVTGKGPSEPDLRPFHAQQTYLGLSGPLEVVVPFGDCVNEPDKGLETRNRRDLAQLFNLIRAHALLCIGTRQRDEQNRVVAIVDDYATVLPLVAVAFPGEATGLTPKQREAVEAVAALLESGKPATLKTIGDRLGNVRSTLQSKLKKPEILGYIRRTDDGGKGTTATYALGEPLPSATSSLPTVETVQKRWQAMRQAEANSAPFSAPRKANDSEEFNEGVPPLSAPLSAPQKVNYFEGLGVGVPNSTATPEGSAYEEYIYEDIGEGEKMTEKDRPGDVAGNSIVDTSAAETGTATTDQADPAFFTFEEWQGLTEQYEERAAIMEHDGNLPRAEAERKAFEEVVSRRRSRDRVGI